MNVRNICTFEESLKFFVFPDNIFTVFTIIITTGIEMSWAKWHCTFLFILEFLRPAEQFGRYWSDISCSRYNVDIG